MKDLSDLEQYLVENPLYTMLAEMVDDETRALMPKTYFIPYKNGVHFWVLCSTSYGWEHVSVSLRNEQQGPIERCPKWSEMCVVKDLFFDDEECVVQFHPPKSQYVDRYPYALHLWKPVDVEMPIPPSDLV